MARPRASYGLSITQILDYVTDCSKDDLMSILAVAITRRQELRANLETKRASIEADLNVLDSLDTAVATAVAVAATLEAATSSATTTEESPA